MATVQPGYGSPAMDPVSFVMQQCQCDESRARSLLATAKNDPTRAVSYYQRMNAMLAQQGHSRSHSQSRPASQSNHAPPHVDNSQGPGFLNPSNPSSSGSGWTQPPGPASLNPTSNGLPGAAAMHNGFRPSPMSSRGNLRGSNSTDAAGIPAAPPYAPHPTNATYPGQPSEGFMQPPSPRNISPVAPAPQKPPTFAPKQNMPPQGNQQGYLAPGFPSPQGSQNFYPAINGPISDPNRTMPLVDPPPSYNNTDWQPEHSIPSHQADGEQPARRHNDGSSLGGAISASISRSAAPTSHEYDAYAPPGTDPPPMPLRVPPVQPGDVLVTPPPSSSVPPPVPQPAPVPCEWDFRLPLLPEEEAVTIIMAGRENANGVAQPSVYHPSGGEFNLRELCAAVQHGADLQTIRKYLREFQTSTIKRRINGTVEGVPSVFFAVGTNDPALLRLWAGYGANISDVHPASGTPLLAYAIALSNLLDGRDTSQMVATLLSLGASPKAIPEEFYTPYNRDLPEDGQFKPLQDDESDEDEYTSADDDDAEPSSHKASSTPAKAVKDEWRWCSAPSVRSTMARTTNLTQRYYLDRATRLKRAGVRHRQIAALRNAEAILGIPYYLIGQTIAANRLLRKLLTYITVPSKKPLVLTFAGPSGHGKTELARKLGYLLGLELQVVDCTIVNTEKELFGPRAPYVGWEAGSPLNNFIAQNAGRRSIVFLDEFEKTSREIHQSLLLPFDNGEYQDRRSLASIDCSRTIWILATNALDDTIIQFCGANPAILQHENERQAPQDSTGKLDKGGEAKADDAAAQGLSRKLSSELRAAFLARFGAPVTGRVSDFIPFLPFSKGEQAVVVHKFLIELAEKVAAPVRLRMGAEEQLLGNVRLSIRRDASVCARLAEAEYSEELGARSLRKAVDEVQDRLVSSYLDEDCEIEEDGLDGGAGASAGAVMARYVVDVQADEIVVRKEIVV